MSLKLTFLIIVLLFYCFDFFLRIAPSLVVSELILQYQMTGMGYALLSVSFYIGYTLFQIPAGFVIQRYPIKKVLSVTILTCLLAFVGFTLSSSFALGFFFRLCIGVGSASSFILILHFSKLHLPASWFTVISGVAISLSTFSASMAQSFVAYMMESSPWHSVFILSALSGVLLLFALFLLPDKFYRYLESEKKQERHKISLNWPVLKNYLIQAKLWKLAILAGLYYLPTSVLAATWGIYYLEQQLGLTKVEGAYAISCLFMGWALASPVFGFCLKKNRHLFFYLVIGLLGVALCVLGIIFGIAQSREEVYGLFLLLGCVSGLQVTVWGVANKILLTKEDSGIVIGLMNTIIMLTTGVGQLLTGFWVQ